MILIKNRIAYIDTLKFIGILSIIAVHVFQLWNNGQQIFNFEIYSLVEIVSSGVPLFLMISGALLLNRDIEIKNFLKKRYVRLCFPFVFYLIIHLLVYYPNHFNIFEYNWYFWMIICVYLCIPVINKFIQYSNIEEVEYFLLIFFIGSIIYQVFYYFRVSNFINLIFFVAPLGYLVLGYYLSSKDLPLSSQQIVSICICVLIFITFLKILGSLNIIPYDLTHNFKVSQSKIFLSNLDLSSIEIIEASSIFLLIKNIYSCKKGVYSKIHGFLSKSYIKRFILSISRASYGMYLINRTIMLFFDNRFVNVPLSGTEICWYIVLITIFIFIISWLIVLLVNRIPYLNKFSGYS